MKVTGIIIILITSTVSKHHQNSLRRSLLKVKGDFFNILNKSLYDIVEKIFKCLNLVTDVLKNPNMQLLLKMHNDLSNIVNKYFDTFNEIQRITITNDSNLTENMIRINKVVDDVLRENNFSVYGHIRGKKHKHARNKTKIKNKSKHKNTSEVEDSDEFHDFVMDFVKQFDELRIKYLTSSSPKPVRRSIPFRRNLKVWKPSFSMETMNLSNKTHSRRVYKGTSTTVKEYAFVVSIHIIGEFVCAGSIISRDLVITAASCLEVAYQNNFLIRSPNSVYVRIGSDYTMQDGEAIPVQELYFHPSYSSHSLRHNLVLIKLEKSIRFTREKQKIRRVMWDRTSESLRADIKSVVVAGWGATKADQKMNHFQKLTVDALDIYPIRECTEIYSKRFVNKENFCAGFTKSKGGACNGDIGAPGIVGATLTGIVSFGAPVCGSANAPTVFTKIGYYTSWIQSIMGPDLRRRGSLTFSRRLQKKVSNYQPSIYARNHTSLLFQGNNEYLDEVKELESILQELAQLNSTVVDELLYGELYDDLNDLFGSNETDQSFNNNETMKLTSSSTSTSTFATTKKHLRTPVSVSKNTQKGNMDYTDNYEESSGEMNVMSIKVITSKESSEDERLYIKSNEKSTKASEEKKRTLENEAYSLDSSVEDESEITENLDLKNTDESDDLSIRYDKRTGNSYE